LFEDGFVDCALSGSIMHDHGPRLYGDRDSTTTEVTPIEGAEFVGRAAFSLLLSDIARASCRHHPVMKMPIVATVCMP
jgi:hypothetical protein